MFFVMYHRHFIAILVMLLVAIFIINKIVKREAADVLEGFLVLGCVMLFSILNFVSPSVTSDGFDNYFNNVHQSKNFINDKGSLTSIFYSIEGKDIIDASDMTMDIINKYVLEVNIKNMDKDYLSNKGSSDPDLNICDSIANSAKKYGGIVENTSSCVSNGSMKIFFNMTPRLQGQYQNSYIGQQQEQQANGCYNQPMQQQNGYYAPQVKSGSSVN